MLNPVVYALEWMPATVPAEQVASFGRSAYNRPLGIGLLLGGALMGILVSLPSIKEALKSVAVASKLGSGREELGLGTLTLAVLAAFVLLFVAADFVTDRPLNQKCPVTDVEFGAAVGDEEPVIPVTTQYNGYAIGCADNAALEAWKGWDDAKKDEFLATLNARPGWLASLNKHLRAAIIAFVGALWMWLAGIIIAQCTGMTDWSPVSGLALLTVVLVMLLAGTGAVIGAVLLGSTLCVAMTLAADMMSDMKTGYLVGAQPRRQQTVELLVVGIGPVVSMLTLLLIVGANLKRDGLAMGPGTSTTAPQAQALQAVIVGVQGGQMPYALYGLGAVMGLFLGAGAFPGLGVLVGLSMYLPFEFIATYGVGCVVQMIVSKWKGRDWAESWGVPLSAGLIVGESVLALLINIYILSIDSIR